MRAIKLFLVLIVLVGLLAASAPAVPVSAQTTWEAGDYSGWVYLLARLTKQHKIQQEGVDLTQDTAVFWQAHGDMEVKVNAAGEGSLNAILPLEISALETGGFTTAAGNCSFNIAAKGEAYPQTMGMLTPVSLTDEMSFGLLMPSVSASVSSKNVQGQCGTMDQSSLFIEDTLKNTTSKMLEMTFKVGFRTPLSVGGTCELKDWDMSMPMPNGQLQREMLQCSWRVFREPK